MKNKGFLYAHAITLYDILKAEAVNGEFSGSMVQAYKKTNASMTYYSQVFGILAELGSIEILHRGRRGSTIRILDPPGREAFETIYPQSLTASRRYDSLESRVTILERRLKGIDVVAAIANFERRVRALEAGGREWQDDEPQQTTTHNQEELQ